MNQTSARDYRKTKLLADVGERIRERRTGAGLSMSGLAGKCDVSKSTIDNAEAGHCASLVLLVDIAHALDTTLDDLVPV